MRDDVEVDIVVDMIVVECFYVVARAVTVVLQVVNGVQS